MARSAAMAMVGHQIEAIYVVTRSPMKRCSRMPVNNAAPATQLAPAKANGYVMPKSAPPRRKAGTYAPAVPVHVPLYLR